MTEKQIEKRMDVLVRKNNKCRASKRIVSCFTCENRHNCENYYEYNRLVVIMRNLRGEK